MALPNGVILYQGPSMLDGSPIVCIATGLKGKASRNTKTGGLIQTWILRADMSPIVAVRTGADSAICATCPARGIFINGKLIERWCYVNHAQAPNGIFKCFARGGYPSDWTSETFAGRKVRAGSYGDPAAVPFHVWERVFALSAGRTGYTHQWARFPELAAFVMASCDSEADVFAARLLGFRTFRTRFEHDRILAGEFKCPASKESGHRTTCDKCLACDGNANGASRKASPVIIAHGPKGKMNAYKAWRARQAA